MDKLDRIIQVTKSIGVIYNNLINFDKYGMKDSLVYEKNIFNLEILREIEKKVYSELTDEDKKYLMENKVEVILDILEDDMQEEMIDKGALFRRIYNTLEVSKDFRKKFYLGINPTNDYEYNNELYLNIQFLSEIYMKNDNYLSDDIKNYVKYIDNAVLVSDEAVSVKNRFQNNNSEDFFIERSNKLRNDENYDIILNSYLYTISDYIRDLMLVNNSVEDIYKNQNYEEIKKLYYIRAYINLAPDNKEFIKEIVFEYSGYNNLFLAEYLEKFIDDSIESKSKKKV